MFDYRTRQFQYGPMHQRSKQLPKHQRDAYYVVSQHWDGVPGAYYSARTLGEFADALATMGRDQAWALKAHVIVHYRQRGKVFVHEHTYTIDAYRCPVHHIHIALGDRIHGDARDVCTLHLPAHQRQPLLDHGVLPELRTETRRASDVALDRLARTGDTPTARSAAQAARATPLPALADAPVFVYVDGSNPALALAQQRMDRRAIIDTFTNDARFRLFGFSDRVYDDVHRLDYGSPRIHEVLNHLARMRHRNTAEHPYAILIEHTGDTHGRTMPPHCIVVSFAEARTTTPETLLARLGVRPQPTATTVHVQALAAQAGLGVEQPKATGREGG